MNSSRNKLKQSADAKPFTPSSSYSMNNNNYSQSQPLPSFQPHNKHYDNHRLNNNMNNRGGRDYNNNNNNNAMQSDGGFNRHNSHYQNSNNGNTHTNNNNSHTVEYCVLGRDQLQMCVEHIFEGVAIVIHRCSRRAASPP